MGWRAILITLVLAGCAASGPSGPSRPAAPGLTLEQRQRLVDAERLYRSRSEEFVSVRDELLGHPATTYWLVMFLIRDLVWARDHRPVNDTSFLAMASGRNDPVEERALAQIEAMGLKAVPCIVETLLRHPHGDRCALGASTIARIGFEAIPALAPLLEDGDPKIRAHSVAALAGMVSTPEVLACLEPFLEDPDFRVRVTACRGFARGGVQHAPRLYRVLREDGDGYVCRQLAPLLAKFKDRGAAVVLVEYLERCVDDGDVPGAKAAGDALREISGRERVGSVEVWKAWLSGWSGGKI